MKLDDYKAILELCLINGCEALATNIGKIHVLEFNGNPITFSPDLEATIDEEWEKMVAEGKAIGNEPKNNPFVHCYGHSKTRKDKRTIDIGLRLGQTDWKHYSATKRIGSPIIWGIGTAGVTYFINKHGERVYVFATRNLNKVSDIGGRIETPPAGFLDISLVAHPDTLKENMLQEFEEELGLPRDRIRSLIPISFIRIPRYHDYSIDYLIEAGASEEELSEGFKRSSKYRGEHSSHFFVPESQLRSFIEKHHSQLPPRTKSDITAYLLSTPLIKEK